MKALSFEQLEVGKLYNTIRQRTYPRPVFAQPIRVDMVGEIQREDAFVILELENLIRDGYKEKWVKVLTTQGIIGWTLFIETFDPDSSTFVELSP